MRKSDELGIDGLKKLLMFKEVKNLMLVVETDH